MTRFPIFWRWPCSISGGRSVTTGEGNHMKQRTSWARRMRALTAAAWASAGLANSASATISFIPNTPDSTLRVTHTADLSIGAAGTSFKDVIPVADSGNIYPTNKYYQYGSKTLTYTSSGNTAT